MLTVRIQEKNYSESIMVLKLKDGGEKMTYDRVKKRMVFWGILCYDIDNYKYMEVTNFG